MTRIAVIGAGNWGKNLVRAFAGLGDAELVCVCDRDPDRRAAVQRQHPGVATTAQLANVLTDERIDAIAVATPAPSHADVAEAGLRAGKHVYVEKPLTLRSADAIPLLELAKRAGRTLMVGHLMMYHPAVEHMKGMIRSGELDPSYLYFQRVNLGVVRREENAWWSLAPHDISIACYLLDRTPVSVSATGRAYLQPGVEDVVFANLCFADGTLANIHVSWLDPHKERKVTLVGKQRMVVFDDMSPDEKVRVYEKSADVEVGQDAMTHTVTVRSGEIRIPSLPGGEPLRLECEHFISAIRSGRAPRSDGADGLRVVRVLEAGERSMRQGGVEVPVEGATGPPTVTLNGAHRREPTPTAT